MKRERRFAAGQRHPTGGHYSPGMHRSEFSYPAWCANASRAATPAPGPAANDHRNLSIAILYAARALEQ